ncbi:hypothetical protein DesLBE_0663 [Desulfitobacterium sp. LBE]|nr:hypothetical protein DesLBE_0663 [Desulfitobacterium sp. LBE]
MVVGGALGEKESKIFNVEDFGLLPDQGCAG